MSKIILGNLVRHLVTLLIGFFVARHMLAEDVARKLYAGDVVELWGGAWSVSIKQVVDFLTLSLVPILVPVLLGAWLRIKDKYKLIVARLNPHTMTNAEVKADVKATPATTIIHTVINKP
jgi:hypothetical protein